MWRMQESPLPPHLAFPTKDCKGFVVAAEPMPCPRNAAAAGSGDAPAFMCMFQPMYQPCIPFLSEARVIADTCIFPSRMPARQTTFGSNMIIKRQFAKSFGDYCP